MAWCCTAKTAVSTGCSRRSECCERTIGTSPPSDAAAMLRCVRELCAPQNTSPRAKVYTVIVVASMRSARYLAHRVAASSAWCGAAWGGQPLVLHMDIGWQCEWLEPRSARHTVPSVPREAAQRACPHVGGKREQPLYDKQRGVGFVRQRR